MNEAMRLASCLWVLLMVIGSGTALAQRMEQPAGFEPGDVVIYNWTLNNKTQLIETEWTGVAGDDVVGVAKVGGKEFELAESKVPFVAHKGICLANGQACTFTPSLDLAVFPLEKGKRWNREFTVKGEKFTVYVTQERKFDKIEKIKVPAGEFETFKVAFEGRFRGTDSKGGAFSGKEEGAEWITTVGGKLVLVHVIYRNSFGEKVSLDLVSTRLK